MTFSSRYLRENTVTEPGSLDKVFAYQMADLHTVAVLPVKRFEESLQRLAGTLGGGARTFLAQSMFRDVLGALLQAKTIDDVAIVTGDRHARDVADTHGVWAIDDPLDSGHSDAVQLALDQCNVRGFKQALLVPVDCPLIDPREIDAFIAGTREDDLNVVIVPDRHGTGTNALLLRPPASMTPSFGPDSMQVHRSMAEEKGLNYRVVQLESLQLDIDTGDDLDKLHAELERVHGLAPLPRGSVRQLKRMADADAKRRESLSMAFG